MIADLNLFHCLDHWYSELLFNRSMKVLEKMSKELEVMELELDELFS